MREDRYLNISDVTKSYPNPFGDEIAVVKGFDLTVTKGEVISIIGHSGCGKSTVLNMVAGLIPVSLGGIILESCEVKDPGPDRAVVFQAPCLLPWLTSMENVLLGLKSAYPDLNKTEHEEIAKYCLYQVGLDGSLNKYPREMSGGMQQRVGIARAIALKPKVLLLDEPFGRLDSLTRLELQDVILNILDLQKITTLLVTHDVDEAIYMADRICMMTNGPRAKVGRILEIKFPRPRDREEILEDPDFYDFRQELLQFLDDCEAEKEKKKESEMQLV
jgi:nitrate/nitrite transport system ATP-binding protein|tara:strand:+ start:244 stop:1068 length:825 start_codon:yes stop_codon:yes gene_type:complete